MAPTALAPAPSRATTTITLSLGVMTIPLSVFTGVEETRVKRAEFYKGDVNVPVGRAAIRKDTGEVIDSADVVRMAESDDGVRVELSDDEIAVCTTERGLAEVVCFVRDSKVGQYLVTDVKQVRPKREKGKGNPAFEQAFALLLTGLKDRKCHALVHVAMRGPARYALLDHRGNLYLVASADQVRQEIPRESFNFDAREVGMIGALIDAVGLDTPVLVDTTAPSVQRYVNDKAAGVPREIHEPVAAIPVDIMSQLEASIDAAKAAKGVVA
jgi:non-homologous end joining protein Ku